MDKVADIPVDYYGVMGVPITFLDKYNPDQFEIVAFRKGLDGKDLVYSLNSGGEERERERRKLHTSEYLSDNFNSRNDKECRRNDSRQNYICTNYDSKEKQTFDDVIRPILNGKKIYRRITIRLRRKNEN